MHGDFTMADADSGQRDYSRYQKQVIRRYYDQLPALTLQRLAELVTELYLAEGKKKEKLWQQVRQSLTKLGLPERRIEHVVQQGKPELLAEVVKEWEGKR